MNDHVATLYYDFSSRSGAKRTDHRLEAGKTRQEAATKFESKCEELRNLFIFIVEFSVGISEHTIPMNNKN